jgi:hypothetical protein
VLGVFGVFGVVGVVGVVGVFGGLCLRPDILSFSPPIGTEHRCRSSLRSLTPCGVSGKEKEEEVVCKRDSPSRPLGTGTTTRATDKRILCFLGASHLLHVLSRLSSLAGCSRRPRHSTTASHNKKQHPSTLIMEMVMGRSKPKDEELWILSACEAAERSPEPPITSASIGTCGSGGGGVEGTGLERRVLETVAAGSAGAISDAGGEGDGE